MRVLLWGVSPAVKTGYGIGVAELAPRLAKRGFDVAIFAMAGQGGESVYRGVPVFGGRGRDDLSLLPLIANTVWRADVLVTWFDVWKAAGDFDPEKLPPIVAYPLIDHIGPSPRYERLFRDVSAIVAPTAFAEAEIDAYGYAAHATIPHGVDTAVFKPQGKRKARAAFGIDGDRFVALTVATNLDFRKNLSGMMAAWREFVQSHPSALWLLWTDPCQHGIGSYDLRALWKSLSGDSENIWMPGCAQAGFGLDNPAMASIYNCADVLFSCSWGEGFGFTTIEAMACGVPVIGADNTTYPELLGAGHMDAIADNVARRFPVVELDSALRGQRGWLVECPARIAQPVTNGWQAIPSHGGMVAALEDAARHAKRRQEMGMAGREFVVDGYDWETVADMWADALYRLPARRQLSVPVAPTLITAGGSQDAA